MLVSIWAMVFLVIWKRKQYELTYKWNCSDFEDSDELIRPKYVQKAAGRIKYIPGKGLKLGCTTLKLPPL